MHQLLWCTYMLVMFFNPCMFFQRIGKIELTEISGIAKSGKWNISVTDMENNHNYNKRASGSIVS